MWGKDHWSVTKITQRGRCSFCNPVSGAGEVQGRPEEDPQACDRHGWVSVHAAQPEHQQTVQPSKTSSSSNTFPPRKAAGSQFGFIGPSAVHRNMSELSVSVTPPPPHSAPSSKHPLSRDLIWWWPLPFLPVTLWPFDLPVLSPSITSAPLLHFGLFPPVTFTKHKTTCYSILPLDHFSQIFNFHI